MPPRRSILCENILRIVLSGWMRCVHGCACLDYAGWIFFCRVRLTIDRRQPGSHIPCDGSIWLDSTGVVEPSYLTLAELDRGLGLFIVVWVLNVKATGKCQVEWGLHVAVIDWTGPKEGRNCSLLFLE